MKKSSCMNVYISISPEYTAIIKFLLHPPFLDDNHERYKPQKMMTC